MENSLKKTASFAFAFCIVMSGLFCWMIKWDATRAVKFNLQQSPLSYGEANREHAFYCYIDEIVEVDDTYVRITGWAARVDADIRVYDTRIVLHDIQEDCYLRLPSRMVVRHDVTAAFSSEQSHNLDRSGIVAYCKKKDLKAPFSRYQIIFIYKNEGRCLLVNSGVALPVDVIN